MIQKSNDSNEAELRVTEVSVSSCVRRTKKTITAVSKDGRRIWSFRLRPLHAKLSRAAPYKLVRLPG